MKTNLVKLNFGRVCALLGAAGGLMLLSGCIVEVTPDGEAPPPPAPVIVDAPPPVVVEPVVEVPDYYCWDGYEYVGVVGVNYYYLGPGSVWVVCDTVRVERFHTWEGYHSDWRDHAIYNDRYRRDARGNFHPARPEAEIHRTDGNNQPPEHIGGQPQTTDHRTLQQPGQVPAKKTKTPPKKTEGHPDHQ
jgi:hypothetical protein